MQGQQQTGFTGFPRNYMLQNFYSQPLYSQIPNTYTSLVRLNPQKVRTTDEKSEDPKFDFLFATMQSYPLKLSDMNHINSIKVSELDPETINQVKAIDDRINQVHKTTIDCKSVMTSVSHDLLTKAEESIKDATYGVKNIYLKIHRMKVQFTALNAEFDAYANIVKSFEDSYQSIKNDSRQVYIIPSKVVTSVISILLKKVQTLQLDVEDLTQLIQTQALEESRQDSDDVDNYAAICEALYLYLQELVLKSSNVLESIKTLKQRAYGWPRDGHGHGGISYEHDDSSSVFKEDVFNRLNEIIKKIN